MKNGILFMILLATFFGAHAAENLCMVELAGHEAHVARALYLDFIGKEHTEYIVSKISEKLTEYQDIIPPDSVLYNKVVPYCGGYFYQYIIFAIIQFHINRAGFVEKDFVRELIDEYFALFYCELFDVNLLRIGVADILDLTFIFAGKYAGKCMEVTTRSDMQKSLEEFDAGKGPAVFIGFDLGAKQADLNQLAIQAEETTFS